MFTKWIGMAAASLLGAALLVGGMGSAAPPAASTLPEKAAMAQGLYGENTWMRIRVNGEELEGDTYREDRQGQIEIHGFENAVITAREAGSGLATGRRQYQPLLIRKRIDKSSPLLMKALTTNSVVEVQFSFYRPNPTGDGTEEHFYTVELRQARVASVKMVQNGSEPPTEEISFVFHTITWTYEDGGITHEDTWDSQR